MPWGGGEGVPGKIQSGPAKLCVLSKSQDVQSEGFDNRGQAEERFLTSGAEWEVYE